MVCYSLVVMSEDIFSVITKFGGVGGAPPVKALDIFLPAKLE